MFLSRVLMEEGQATIDHAKISPVGSAPFSNLVVSLEREFCRVLKEREFSEVSHAYDEVEGCVLDYERESRARLKDVHVGSFFENLSEGCELRAMAVLKGEYEPSRPKGASEVPEESEI